MDRFVCLPGWLAYTADAPGSAGSADFTATVDDTATAGAPRQALARIHQLAGTKHDPQVVKVLIDLAERGDLR